MPPVSSEERTLATLLPSGEPLPRFGPADERAQRGGTLSLPSSSRFSARLRESLQGSLSAAISTLSVPEVRASRPLATVGEETLLTALRAALRSVHQLPAALPRNAVASHCARAALVAAARTCVGVFAGYALQAATVQLDELRRSLAFALGHDRANRGEDKAAGVRRQLQGFARELRRLPQALRGWADDAMDAEAIEDNGTRRQVLSVVAAEVAGLAQAGVAAAEAAASA